MLDDKSDLQRNEEGRPHYFYYRENLGKNSAITLVVGRNGRLGKFIFSMVYETECGRDDEIVSVF